MIVYWNWSSHLVLELARPFVTVEPIIRLRFHLMLLQMHARWYSLDKTGAVC